MKALQFSFKTPVIAMALLSFFLLPACKETAPTSLTQNDHYEGEALFRGILFAEGEVAAQIPEYAEILKAKNELSVAEQSRMREIQDRLVAEIKTENPEYFGKFQAAVTGGNHVVIRAKVQEAAQMVHRLLSEYTEVALSEEVRAELRAKMVNNDDNASTRTLDYKKLHQLKEDLGGDVVVSGPQNLSPVYAVVVAVVAVTAVAVALEFWFWSRDVDDDSALTQEEIINTLATQFSKN